MGHSGIMCNFLSKQCATMLVCNMLSLNRHRALELHLRFVQYETTAQVGDAEEYEQSHLLCFFIFPQISLPPLPIV